MSGQATTLGQGVVALGLSIALVGVSGKVDPGSVTAVIGGGSDLTLALTGSGIASASGTLLAPGAQALTGIASTTGIGSLTVVIRPTDISNPAIGVSAGILTAVGDNVTCNISGVEATGTTGTITAGVQFISGQAITPAAGTASSAADVPLSGAASSVSTGTITPNQAAIDTLITSSSGSPSLGSSVPMVGSVSTLAQGSLGVTGDSSTALTGSASTTAAGTVAANQALPITGQSITSAQANVGAPGGVVLAGSQVQVIDGSVFITSDRSFALSGQQITVIDGVTSASSLAFPQGQGLISDLQGIGPRAAVLAGLESQAQAGIVSPPLPISTGGGGGRKKHKHKHRAEEKPEPSVVLRREREQIEEIQSAAPKTPAVPKPVKTDLPTPDPVDATHHDEEIALLMALFK